MSVIARPILAMLSALLAFQAQAQPAAPASKTLLQQAVDRFEAKDKGTRIVGGTKASWENNRWQVALVYAKDSDNARAQFCGGSMIAPGWVLTAAHCIDRKFDASAYEVLTGTDSLRIGGKRSRVTNYIVHEGWGVAGNKSQYDDDVALLKIDPATPLNGEPIALTPANMNPDGLQILITGWGVTETRPNGTDTLQQVIVPAVTQATCNAQKAYDGAVTERMFCAGTYQKDSCQGDSGGPATAVVNGKRLLMGVVSWGIGCGERDKYGVYTRLPFFTGWISQSTGGAVK